jgi:eukaryotic-like serine/threonine-protein kinase
MITTSHERQELDSFIQAYEKAQEQGEAVDFAAFLPPPCHPLYAEVRSRLLARQQQRQAADEHGDDHNLDRTLWINGRAGMIRDELGSVAAPEVADLSAALLEATTAQVPVRVQGPGELGIESGWLQQNGAGLSKVPSQSESHVARELARALAEMPEPGDEFLGFRILGELGRGAFGRVYLAQQPDLASRFVALKVSTNILGESQALAQLQHTNIVPIYSIHRACSYQAVCMPYFGATTIADLLRSWRQHEALPDTGKALVETLCNRKSITRQLHTLVSGAAASGDGAGASSFELRTSVEDRSSKLEARSSKLDGFPPDPSPLNTDPSPQGTAILDMLQGLTFVEAVLWIGSRLADGLVHAHERGIYHRDLKPANVLLTDEGQPMLLDFGVAVDTKRHSGAHLGGTLCYMAPEHLEAFQGGTRTVDGRSDLYSLGLILFELLTRRVAFPIHKGGLEEILPCMLEDRKGPPPRLRCWNKTVSPAVESIVRHCLEPDPAKRYQSAHELREDLDLHRSDLPLKYASEPSIGERTRKWMRRHPRLASTTSIVILAGLLVSIAVGWSLMHSYRLGELEAREKLARFHEDAKTVQFLLNARSVDRDQLDLGLKLGHDALASYQVLQSPSWADQPAVVRLSASDQDTLHAEMQELLLLLSRATLLQTAPASSSTYKVEQLQTALRLNRLSESVSPGEPPAKALLSQRAELLHMLGFDAEASRLHDQAEQTSPRTARDYYLAGSDRLAQGRYGEALPLLQIAADKDPQSFWTQLLLGICYDGLARDLDARACYTTGIALWPEFPWTYFNRGLVYLRQNDFQHALADFGHVIRLRPDFAEVYMNRALAWQGIKDYQHAIHDLTYALELGAPYTRIYFMRSRVRALAGDRTGASHDLAEGLRRQPTDEKSWIARGIAKLPGDLPGALSDFEKAADVNPRSLAAWQNQAHVLGTLGRNQEAAHALDRALELYPDYVPARAARGVMRARLGQRKAAHEDADESLARDFGPATQYQVAGIFALTSRQEPDDLHQALHCLASALRKGYGFDFLEQDPDLDPIRDRPEFRQLVNATRALQAMNSPRQEKLPK